MTIPLYKEITEPLGVSMTYPKPDNGEPLKLPLKYIRVLLLSAQPAVIHAWNPLPVTLLPEARGAHKFKACLGSLVKILPQNKKIQIILEM